MQARRSLHLFVFSILLLCLCPAVGDPSARVLAQAGFGPETFTRTSKGKDQFIRLFTVGNTSVPYTLTITNGSALGGRRVAKGSLTLNGRTLIDKTLFNRRAARIRIALNPLQQNELKLRLKGGAAGDFVTISIEQTRSTLINDPDDPGFDASQEGLAVPFKVEVDQQTHRAYISDKFADAVFEFDVNGARIVRKFAGVDGDSSMGNGATSGISLNRVADTIVALNEGQDAGGSIALINIASGAIDVRSLSDGEDSINPAFVAVNPDSNVAAFNALYGPRGRRAHFINLLTGEITAREEDMNLNSTAYNPATGEFVFTGFNAGPPALFVYRGAAPFERLSRIESSARAGTGFDRVAINPETNIAVAVNQRDSAVFLFDLALGREVARIPINVGNIEEPAADVAVNPLTNMAVITSRYLPRLTVIDLNTRLVAAEIPLPPNTRALGVGVDHQLNRAIISENGHSSSRRNGSIFVVELPEP